VQIDAFIPKKEEVKKANFTKIAYERPDDCPF
jgi:hypothetical protein